MLKKTTKDGLKKIGFDVEKFIAAVKDEAEVDFTIPEINHLTEEELSTRDTQVIAAAKPDIFKAGKDAGIEIAGKAIAKKYALTDVDVKDPEKVIAALDSKVSKGDAGLQSQVDALIKDKETLEAAVLAEKNTTKATLRDVELISSLPVKRLPVLTDREYLLAINANLQIEEVDGAEVVKRNGEILRDTKTQKPIAKKDAITQLFEERKWIGEESRGGRGGNDNPGGGSAGLKTFSKYEEQWKKDNPNGNVLSPEFQTAVAAAAKETTDFNWDA
jgi:hypothetical protein